MTVLRIRNVPDGSRIEIKPAHREDQDPLIMENASSSKEEVLFKIEPNFYCIKISGPDFYPTQWGSINIFKDTVLDAVIEMKNVPDSEFKKQLKLAFKDMPVSALPITEENRDLNIGKMRRSYTQIRV